MEFITLLALHHHQWSLGIKDANESGFFTVKPEISTHETNFPGSNFKELNSSKTGSRFDEIFIKVKEVNPMIDRFNFRLGKFWQILDSRPKTAAEAREGINARERLYAI